MVCRSLSASVVPCQHVPYSIDYCLCCLNGKKGAKSQIQTAGKFLTSCYSFKNSKRAGTTVDLMQIKPAYNDNLKKTLMWQVVT
jgi:hypothetical protein